MNRFKLRFIQRSLFRWIAQTKLGLRNYFGLETIPSNMYKDVVSYLTSLRYSTFFGPRYSYLNDSFQGLCKYNFLIAPTWSLLEDKSWPNLIEETIPQSLKLNNLLFDKIKILSWVWQWNTDVLYWNHQVFIAMINKQTFALIIEKLNYEILWNKWIKY